MKYANEINANKFYAFKDIYSCLVNYVMDAVYPDGNVTDGGAAGDEVYDTVMLLFDGLKRDGETWLSLAECAANWITNKHTPVLTLIDVGLNGAVEIPVDNAEARDEIASILEEALAGNEHRIYVYNGAYIEYCMECRTGDRPNMEYDAFNNASTNVQYPLCIINREVGIVQEMQYTDKKTRDAIATAIDIIFGYTGKVDVYIGTHAEYKRVLSK